MVLTINNNNKDDILTLKGNPDNTIGIPFSNPEPLQLKCYKCKNIFDKLIQVVEKDKDDPYGLNWLGYCKNCFKNFLNT